MKIILRKTKLKQHFSALKARLLLHSWDKNNMFAEYGDLSLPPSKISTNPTCPPPPQSPSHKTGPLTSTAVVCHQWDRGWQGGRQGTTQVTEGCGAGTQWIYASQIWNRLKANPQQSSEVPCTQNPVWIAINIKPSPYHFTEPGIPLESGCC